MESCKPFEIKFLKNYMDIIFCATIHCKDQGHSKMRYSQIGIFSLPQATLHLGSRSCQKVSLFLSNLSPLISFINIWQNIEQNGRKVFYPRNPWSKSNIPSNYTKEDGDRISESQISAKIRNLVFDIVKSTIMVFL